MANAQLELGVAVFVILVILHILGFDPFRVIASEVCSASNVVLLTSLSLAFFSRGQWLPSEDALPAWVKQKAPAWLTKLYPHAPVPAEDTTLLQERLKGEKLKKTLSNKSLASNLNKARPMLAFVPGLSVWDMDHIDHLYALLAGGMLLDVVLSFLNLLVLHPTWYLIITSGLGFAFTFLTAIADAILEQRIFDGVYFDSPWPFAEAKFSTPETKIPPEAKVYRVSQDHRWVYSRGLKAIAYICTSYQDWSVDEGCATIPTMAHPQSLTNTIKLVRVDGKNGGRKKATAVVCCMHALCCTFAALTGPVAFVFLRMLCTLSTAYMATVLAWPTSSLCGWVTTVAGKCVHPCRTLNQLCATAFVSMSKRVDVTPPQSNASISSTEQPCEPPPVEKRKSEVRFEPETRVSPRSNNKVLERWIQVESPTSPRPILNQHKFCYIEPKDLNFLESQPIDGGMASVRKAVWKEKEVAVKMPKKSEDPDAFVREAEALAKLDHPNVLKLVGWCEDEHRYMIVTEYLEGGTLFAKLYQFPSKLQPKEKCIIAIGVAKGLYSIHCANMVHQDVSAHAACAVEYSICNCASL